MMWGSRPQYDCPAISRAATAWTSSADSSVISNLKASCGGFVVRRELTPSNPNDEIAIGFDIQSARDWYDQKIGGTDAEFETAIQDAEREILIDLRSPKTCHEIWAEARSFVQQIFPKPENRRAA